MKPYFETELGMLYNCDCRDFMNDELKTETIDLVITSPPYNIGVEYDCYDDKKPKTDYYNYIFDVFFELFGLLKADSRVVVNALYEAKFTHDTNEKVFFASDMWSVLEEAGYQWKGLIDLVEPSSQISRRSAWGSYLSPSSPYFYNPKECLLVVYKEIWKKQQKGTSSFTDENKSEFIKCASGQWDYKSENSGLTKANFSLDIPVPAIKFFTWEEDLIYDPFMGSGTTAIAAEMTGRRWVGTELSKDYCDVIVQRLKDL